MFFPSSFAPFAFSFAGSVARVVCSAFWLPYPGVNPFASIVTLVYSFQLTQTAACVGVCSLYVLWVKTYDYML